MPNVIPGPGKGGQLLPFVVPGSPKTTQVGPLVLPSTKGPQVGLGALFGKGSQNVGPLVIPGMKSNQWGTAPAVSDLVGTLIPSQAPQALPQHVTWDGTNGSNALDMFSGLAGSLIGTTGGTGSPARTETVPVMSQGAAISPAMIIIGALVIGGAVLLMGKK
jgi:hypothetical protein